jgi:hypothetical protein
MHKIRKILFFFGDGLHWPFEAKKSSSKGRFRPHIYICTNETLIQNSLHEFDNWGKYLSYKKDIVQLQ